MSIADARERAEALDVVRSFCVTAPAGSGKTELLIQRYLALLGRVVERWQLSARAARRVLRVARTLADLAGHDATGPEAIAEALEMRVGG